MINIIKGLHLCLVTLKMYFLNSTATFTITTTAAINKLRTDSVKKLLMTRHWVWRNRKLQQLNILICMY